LRETFYYSLSIDNEPVISDNVAPLPCHLNEFIITEQEILDQLKFLNVNKPVGPDGVSPRLLKYIAYSISKFRGNFIFIFVLCFSH
jgi:hypothetical protein